MRTFGIVGLGIVVATIAVLYIAWVTAKDPKFNPASFEDKPLMARLAPIEEATTLAQYLDEGGSPSTMVVISFSERAVTGSRHIADHQWQCRWLPSPFCAFFETSSIRLQRHIAYRNRYKFS